MRKISNKFLNGVEVSAQEAVYGLLGMPLTKSSRDCVFISTGRPEERIVFMKSHEELQNLDPDSTDVAASGLLDHYSHRPKQLEDSTLAEFASYYTFSRRRPSGKSVINEEYNESFEDGAEEDQTVFALDDKSGFVRKRNFPRIIRYRRYGELENQVEFYRECVMLYHPWRNEDNDILNKDVIELYKLNEESINRIRKQYNALETHVLEKVAQEVDEEDGEDECLPDEEFEAMDDFRDEADIFNELFANQTENVVEKIPMVSLLSSQDYQILIQSLNGKQSQYVAHVMKLIAEGKEFLEFVYGGAGETNKFKRISGLSYSNF